MRHIVADEQRRMRPQLPCAHGLRRRGAICGVAAPRRWAHIGFVAASSISPRGASNAARPLSRDRFLTPPAAPGITMLGTILHPMRCTLPR